MTTVAGAASTATMDPAAAIPIVDWGSLVLRAGRVASVLPHIAWLLRFADAVPRQALEEEARRLATTPYGFGRRVESARVLGGRSRWRPVCEPPAVVLAETPAVGPVALGAWLDRELGVPLDPERGAGWRLAATPTDGGGTAVLIVCHHLFGTGRGILGALYGDDDQDVTLGTTETPFTSESTFTVWDEMRSVGERFRLGVLGATALAREAPTALRARRCSRPQPGPPMLKAPRGRDRTRRPPSILRVAAIASMAAVTWDGAASQRGGSGNTLLAAITMNLLRRARIARGGPAEHNLRLLLPVDLQDREVADRVARSSGPGAQMTTAAVLVPGGPPVHGGLRELRERMKSAFLADTGTAPVVRGAGDAMRLLPEAVTFRLAARAALRFDGCASNVGAVPERMMSLGRYEASDVAMLGFPIGNEALTVLIRHRERVSVSVVTDPLRLGSAGDVRAWLAAELDAWGVTDVVW